MAQRYLFTEARFQRRIMILWHYDIMGHVSTTDGLDRRYAYAIIIIGLLNYVRVYHHTSVTFVIITLENRDRFVQFLHSCKQEEQFYTFMTNMSTSPK